MDKENKLLDITCKMLLAYFDTEIEIPKIEESIQEQPKNEPELTDIKPKINNKPIFKSSFENKDDQNEEEEVEKPFEYSPNLLIFEIYQDTIEKKFLSLTIQTNSIILYIKRNGSKFLSEFFYLILKLLTNDHKNKICRAVNIIKTFLIDSSDATTSLFNALFLINSNEETPDDVIENIILLLQILFASYFLYPSDYRYALRILLKESSSINENKFPTTVHLFEERFTNPCYHDIQNERKMNLLQKDNLELREKCDKLKEKIKSLESEIVSRDELLSIQNQTKFCNNPIFNELISQSKIEPNRRRYSDGFYGVMSASFIAGGAGYKILQKYFPIPDESNIRKRFYPFINSYSEYLTNVNLCHNIIKNLNVKQEKNDPLYVAIAIDAAKFKNIKGKIIKEYFSKIITHKDNIFEHTGYIKDETIYKNIFVFHVQPINKNLKPFPIHIRFSDSGAADIEIKNVFDSLRNWLAHYNIIVKFVATDGDHFFDIFHDIFFKKIFKLIKQKMSFKDIINTINKEFLSSDLIIPISDSLHSFKLLRSYFLEGKVHLETLSNITVYPLDLEKYNLGHVLSDNTDIAKMKDAYPLKLFSTETVMKAIEFKDYNVLFFVLPVNLFIESLKNPNLSNDCRIFLLDIVFQFMIFHLFQKNVNKNSIHSRIGVERIINTVIGLAVSLMSFELIKIDSISSHPLENLFGMVRLACFYDHSWKNMLNAIAKGFYLKKIIDENSIDVKRRERVNLAGVLVTNKQSDGDISCYTPFQIFAILWANMKQYIPNPQQTPISIEPFVVWYKSYKKINWNEKIYCPSKLSGSSIRNRYKCEEFTDALSITKRKRKQAKNKKSGQKSEEKRYYLNEIEYKALSYNNIVDFMEFLYDRPIEQYQKNLDTQIKKKEMIFK